MNPWLQLVATALTGGAMGAIITLIATKIRNRKQPIGVETELVELIKKNSDFPSLRALIMKGDDSGPGLAINNLSLVRIKIVNKGNQDMSEFAFGVTLADASMAVDVTVETPDRHHKLEILTPVGLTTPKQEIDFIAKPFNRDSTYTIKINFTYIEEPSVITLGSELPVRFVENRRRTATTMGELLILVALESLGAGAQVVKIRMK